MSVSPLVSIDDRGCAVTSNVSLFDPLRSGRSRVGFRCFSPAQLRRITPTESNAARRMRRIDAPIPYPEPAARRRPFVLRPFREDDFDAALRAGAGSRRGALGAAAAGGRRRGRGRVLRGVPPGRRLAPPRDRRPRERRLPRRGDGWRSGEHRVGELGCGVVPAARGRGVATEALRALTDWAFDDARPRPRAGVRRARERRGARARRAAGFRREGVLRVVLGRRRRPARRVVLARLAGDDAGVARLAPSVAEYVAMSSDEAERDERASPRSPRRRTPAPRRAT